MVSLGSCFELLTCVFSSPLRWLVFAGFPRFVLPPFSRFSGFVLPACCLSVLFLSALSEMLRTSAHERGALAWGGLVLTGSSTGGHTPEHECPFSVFLFDFLNKQMHDFRRRARCMVLLLFSCFAASRFSVQWDAL